MNNEISGDVAPGFEPLADTFASVMDRSHQRGAALHIRIDGKVVADLWGGDAREDVPWTGDTPTVIFSCTKGLVSILVGQLVKDQMLDLDEPVSTYWPEFVGGGKESLPVRSLMAHRAGLPLVREDLTRDDVVDWDRMAGLLASELPLHKPDAGHVYHSLTFGWLAGELIRRQTGMSVGEYLKKSVTHPLGASAWIGVDPTELHRVAQLFTAEGYPPLPPPATAGPDVSELEKYADRTFTLGHAFPFEFAEPMSGFNDPVIQQAEIPGAGGVASARALATIWSATVSNNEQVRLLGPDVIADMSREQSAGQPMVPVSGPFPRWGTGFMLTSDVRPFLSEASFGHDGLGGQVGFADPGSRVGFGFVTNDLQMIDDRRGVDLVESLRSIIL